MILFIEERVDDFIKWMILEEKIDLFFGYNDFYLYFCEWLGILVFKLVDGLLGVVFWGLFGCVIVFLLVFLLVVFWNKNLVEKIGVMYV